MKWTRTSELAGVFHDAYCAVSCLQLQGFKKGPFYLREDTKKDVVPSIVFGAYELWPPGRLFSIPGHVRSFMAS